MRTPLIVLFLVSYLSSAGQFSRPSNVAVAVNLLTTSLPDTTRLRVTDDLVYFYIMKPGSEKDDLDSAFRLLAGSVPIINRVSELSWRGKYDLLRSKAFREGGHQEAGRQSIDHAIGMLKTDAVKLLLADAMLELNDYYSINTAGELLRKTDILENTARLYGEVGAVAQQAHTFEVLGDIYKLQDDYYNSVRVLERSLSLYRTAGIGGIYGLYDLLGESYSMIGDNKKAIEYGLLAVKTAQEIRDTGTIVTLYNRLGISFNSAHMFREALVYFQKSLSAAINVQDTSDIILLSINIATVYRRLDNPTECLRRLKEVAGRYNISSLATRGTLYRAFISTYSDLGQFGFAHDYVEKLKEVNAEAGNRNNTYMILIKYSLATKNYPDVFRYCDSLEAYHQQKNIRAGRQLLHFYRFKADSALGLYIPAIREYQLYQALQDSMFGENSRRDIERLNISFETDKKDNALKATQLQLLALEKSDKLKTEQISRARFNRNVIIVGTLMLLFLLGLLYNQYRIKQNSNEDLLVKQIEINQQNASLQHLVQEKEWLVKEIHHRVKNNLQIAMSLLNTQSRYSGNEHSFAAIRESRQRMYAMSLIHQKLYQANQLTLVNMADYIPELVEFLKESFADGDRFRFQLQVASVELDVSQAVPVGLIINEVVTNAIKYAFPGNVKGNIAIQMDLKPANGINQVTLQVKDDGIGLPASHQLEEAATMGMQLIRTLAEQLGGSVEFNSNNGLLVTLQFNASNHHFGE